MPSQIIPKEHLSACQRWEMNALESVPEAAVAGSGERSAGEGGPQAAVVLPTVEQIERIHQQARQEGYDAGCGAGYQVGLDAGRDAGLRARNEQTAAEVARLQEVFECFQGELAGADQAIAGDVLALALSLAREMVREALRIKPELMLAVVRECIRHDSLLSQPAQLFLHADDAALVKEYLKQELNECAVRVDNTLERGGCRVRVGSSQFDAALATRWQRIAQALGRDSGWLE